MRINLQKRRLILRSIRKLQKMLKRDRTSGTFKKNKIKKKAQLHDPNKYFYSLKFENGLKHSPRETTFEKGNKYKGNFQNDKIANSRVLTFANGDQYKGDFVDNKLEGFGVFVNSEGDCYEGRWMDNQRNGQGKYSYVNGEWRDNEKEGFEEYFFGVGDVYRGELQTGEGSLCV